MRISPYLINKAERLAAVRGTNRTALMVQMIDEGLRRLEREDRNKASAPVPAAQPAGEGAFS